MSERRRAYAYRVLLAVGPLAVFYGLLSEQEVALWLAVAGQTLGLGIAAANTTTKEN